MHYCAVDVSIVITSKVIVKLALSQRIYQRKLLNDLLWIVENIVIIGLFWMKNDWMARLEQTNVAKLHNIVVKINIQKQWN